MTETDELRAALSAGVRRPRLPMFVLGAIALAIAAAGLVVPTDLAGRIIGLIVAALCAAMAVGFYREAARHRRLSETFLSNPQAVVWLTYLPVDSADADGLPLETLGLYFDTGEQVQLKFPEPQGKEIYGHLCTLCPKAVTQTGPALFALWKADPKSFTARAEELPKS
jgi:hypothetical protein